MKIVIDIPKDIYDECNGNVYFPDTGAIVWDAVANGTPLPKGHGRLIDADDVTAYNNLYEVPTIIEADKAENKEYGVKVINRGNCIMCGKKLTEGLFFCKECEAKDRKER